MSEKLNTGKLLKKQNNIIVFNTITQALTRGRTGCQHRIVLLTSKCDYMRPRLSAFIFESRQSCEQGNMPRPALTGRLVGDSPRVSQSRAGQIGGHPE
ncbi:hypothetical protein [Methyloglobulus sp.]|uniref:hypothetical protein n=1 Tax=Methyloglobulus sp. TaxID=2518622 RepID=UPI0039894DDD